MSQNGLEKLSNREKFDVEGTKLEVCSECQYGKASK